MSYETISKGASSFEKLPAGNYQAICLGVFGLGRQKTSFKGKEKITPQIRLIWEVNKKDSAGKRFIVGKTYTNVLSEKSTLRAHLRAWRGRDFSEQELSQGYDTAQFKGKNCFLSISRTDDDKYAFVESVAMVPEGIPTIEQSQNIPDGMMAKIDELRKNAVMDEVIVEHAEEKLDDVPF